MSETTAMWAWMLREWRTTLGMKQHAAGVRLGVSSGTIGRWERGQSAVPPTVALWLSGARPQRVPCYWQSEQCDGEATVALLANPKRVGTRWLYVIERCLRQHVVESHEVSRLMTIGAVAEREQRYSLDRSVAQFASRR